MCKYYLDYFRFNGVDQKTFVPSESIDIVLELTWSNNCLPVVLGWMANSSSASMVVTRTLT